MHYVSILLSFEYIRKGICKNKEVSKLWFKIQRIYYACDNAF
jgi:hypothetical protein